MASPEPSWGVGPPDPTDITTLQPKMMLRGTREGAVAVALGPAARAAAAASGLWCKAFLVLAVCLSATALLYGLGSLAALAHPTPDSLPPPHAGPGLRASPRGTSEDLVALQEDLLKYPVKQQGGGGMVGSAGTSGCFPGAKGDVSQDTNTKGWSLGTSMAQTSLQPGSKHGEGLRLGTAVAVTLSLAQQLGTGVPATSARLTQTVGDPTPGSHALGSLLSTGPGWHNATWVPTSPEHWGTLHRAGLGPAASSEPPAVVTDSSLPSQTRAVTAAQAPSSVPTSIPSTAGGFSGLQHGASVAGATTRSCNEQEEEVRPNPGLPDLGMGKDHTAAPHWVPSESTAGSAETDPGTVWVPSTVTAEMLWDIRPVGTLLHGKAALMVDTILAKVTGNMSGPLATTLASLPTAVSAHGVSHPQVLAPFRPAEESEGSALTSGELSLPSSSPPQQTLPMSAKAHPSLAWTRASSAADPAVTGMSSTATNAIPEPGAPQAPCEDRVATVASSAPIAGGVTHMLPLGPPTQGPDPFFTRVPEHVPATGLDQARQVAEVSMLPGWVAVAEAGHSKPKAASVGPIAAPDGLPGPTHASLGSVPPLSLKTPAPEHRTGAVCHSLAATGLPPPSYTLTSTGVAHAASPQLSLWTLVAPAGMMPDAQSMSSHSVTSQHPSMAGKPLPAAAGEAFTPAELLMISKRGSLGVKPPKSSSPVQPVHVLPLQFRLLGIAYTEALRSKSSGSYRELEEEVRLMLNQMLSTYETFLQANVLEFLNGSVAVRGEALFRGDAPAPTSSHLIRTVITEARKGKSTFGWQLEPQSVQASGLSLENLDPEKLSVSLTVLQLGRGRTDPLQRLIDKVIWSLSALYNVRNFTITQIRNISGDLEITGDIYLDTIIHVDVAEVLQALTALTTCSVDLTSLSVEGARLHLQVYPVSFLITNRRFSEDLMDPLAIGHQELTRDLGDVVARALRDHRNFLQAVIRGFLPGSLICHGDVVFQQPAPTSLEVLEALALSVGPNKALAGSDFQVDPFSLAVGEATLEPPPPKPGFPEYGVVIMVMCGLCIITAPIILLMVRVMSVCWGRRKQAAAKPVPVQGENGEEDRCGARHGCSLRPLLPSV